MKFPKYKWAGHHRNSWHLTNRLEAKRQEEELMDHIVAESVRETHIKYTSQPTVITDKPVKKDTRQESKQKHAMKKPKRPGLLGRWFSFFRR